MFFQLFVQGDRGQHADLTCQGAKVPVSSLSFFTLRICTLFVLRVLFDPLRPGPRVPTSWFLPSSRPVVTGPKSLIPRKPLGFFVRQPGKSHTSYALRLSGELFNTSKSLKSPGPKIAFRESQELNTNSNSCEGQQRCEFAKTRDNSCEEFFTTTMTFSSSQLAYVISTWSAAYGALLELWRHSWAEAQRDGPGDRRGWTAWDGPICGPQCPKNHIYPYMVFVYIYILYMDIYIYIHNIY